MYWRRLPRGTNSEMMLGNELCTWLLVSVERMIMVDGTHKTLPSPAGALLKPRKRTILGWRHSRMMRHSRSKYLCT